MALERESLDEKELEVIQSDKEKSLGTVGVLPPGTTFPRGLPSGEKIRWPLVPSRNLFALKYGKALVERSRRPGDVPVYGTNGRCGSHSEFLFKGPGVILGRKGQGPLGVEWCDGDYWVIDTAYSLTPIRPDVDLKYAYFLIKFIGLNHLKDGTSNPTLGRDAFGAQALPLPPPQEQIAIAHILGALDDKIELNRRMNETLEATARTLFKSWFVDSTGSGIPQGWKAGALGDDFELIMGQSPPGNTYNEEGKGLPFFQGRTDFGSRYPTNRIFCKAPTRLARPGDTLVSVRAPVGDINMAAVKCSIGRGVAAVRHNTGSRSYTFYMMHSLAEVFGRFEADGTVFGSIGKDDFQRIRLIIPPTDLVRRFESTAYPIDQAIENNDKQIDTLSALRDALLPKLISGELRVRCAEGSAGAAP